jgi:hypothetical protein
MLVYGEEFWVFASSPKLRREGIGRYFNLWHSADGRRWENHTPKLEDQKTFTGVNDAAIGPGGMVAVGWEAPQRMGTEYWDKQTPIALFSSDGLNWEKSELSTEIMDDLRIAATESAYYAYGEGAAVWSSADGKQWSKLAPLTLYRLENGAGWTAHTNDDRIHIAKAIGLPQGLIALGGVPYHRGRTILFSGTLPFEYINHK